MASLPLVKRGNAMEDNRNLTQYTENLIRQSYLSVRAALYPYRPDPATLRTQRPVSYLQAKVDYVRVVVWLILNLLLPVSALIMLVVENASKHSGRQRNPLIDAAVAPLLTDVRDVLLEDATGISNMSYLTSDDTRKMGKLRLTPVEIPGAMGTVFAVTKKRVIS